MVCGDARGRPGHATVLKQSMNSQHTCIIGVCDTYYSAVDLDCKWCGALYRLSPIACMVTEVGLMPGCRVRESVTGWRVKLGWTW